MTLLAVLLCAALLSPEGQAQSADTLAEKLVRLRAEVEQLSEDLTTHKTETRNTLQSLARQKSDLQVEIDREETRLAKLRATMGKKRVKMEELSAEGEDLKPVYDSALSGMRGYIGRSLPFKQAERLAELDKIDEQRRTGVLTYPRALTRLWSMVEDEFRMTRESAAFRQTITLDGEEQLADVIRVGMIMLYFQTNDGILGYTRKADDGSWSFVSTDDQLQRKLIRTLFDNFKKQISVGLFQVPNALPPVTK